jgi:hypothetical protein
LHFDEVVCMRMVLQYFELLIYQLTYMLGCWEVFLYGSNGNMTFLKLLGDYADILNAALG